MRQQKYYNNKQIRPMVQNRVVWNIYQEEADKYLEGSADAEEAAENIAQKVDTYLAE